MWTGSRSVRERSREAQKIAPALQAARAGTTARRLDDTRESCLATVHSTLADAAADGIDISSAGEWLLDNYYIVQEHMREIRIALPSEYYQELAEARRRQARRAIRASTSSRSS